jgi:hypothetical protein
VHEVLSVEPLLRLQHLQRLKVYHCTPEAQQMPQQLSSLSSFSALHINVDLEDVVADAWPRLPHLQGLHLWHHAEDEEDRPLGATGVDRPVLRALLQATALQRLSL